MIETFFEKQKMVDRKTIFITRFGILFTLMFKIKIKFLAVVTQYIQLEIPQIS